MKDNILRLGPLCFFLLLGVCLTVVGCESDDEDEILAKTFLEEFDGTKWVAEEYEGYIYYLRVNNNPRIPFEFWSRSADLEKGSKEDSCYGHQDGFMDEDGTEIVENTGNRFTISYGDDEFWCLEIRGGTLKFGFWNAWGDSDSNIWDNPDSIVFKKTTVNVDAFEICPEEQYRSLFSK